MYKQLRTSQVCATVTKPKLRACSLPCRDCTHLSKSLTLGQNAPNTSFCSFASLGVVASAISQHSPLGRLCAPGRCQRIIPFSGQRRPIVSALHLLAQVVTGFSPLPAVNVHTGVAAVGLAWTLRGGSGAVS